MRILSSTLLAEQKKKSLTPLVKIVLTFGATSYIYTKSRILDINHPEQPYNQHAEVFLDNSDGELTNIDLKGFKGIISKGALTSAGEEYDASAPLWVISQQFNSSPGKLDCTLSLIGIPNLLAEDRASALYQPDETDTKTVKTLIGEILGATLAPFSHCKAYEVVWDSEDALIDVYMPKDSLRIYVGNSRLGIVRKLLDDTKCMMLAKADGKIHILQPVISGSVYDYEYSLETGHTFFSKATRNRLVIPGCIIVQSQPDDDPQYSGEAKDPSYDSLPDELKQPQYEQMYLANDAQAVEIAEAILSKYQLWAEAGSADVPMNVGAEVFDYVRVVDARQGDERTGNIGSLTRHYNAEKREWRMTFSFGGWLSVRKLLNDIETNPSGFGSAGQSLARLNVKDAYIENLLAKNMAFVWLDPDNTIDLSKIGDNLDNLPNGVTYARVKTLHLSAEGGIKLDENILYANNYNPVTKEHEIKKQTTAPASPETGDLWLDTSVTPSIMKRWSGSAWIKCDPANLDDLPSGTLYQRTLSSALTPAGLVLLDQTMAGVMGLVKSTDISAGHIKLETTVVSGEWYDESGVEIDATHGINIYGKDNAFTTRATKTGPIQCYVGADGKIYAGAGAVVLDASGIKVVGESIAFYYSTTKRGFVKGTSSGFVVVSWGCNAYFEAAAGYDVHIRGRDIRISDPTGVRGALRFPLSGGIILNQVAVAQAGSLKWDGAGGLYVHDGSTWRHIT